MGAGSSSCQARRLSLLMLCHQSFRLSSVSQKQPSVAKWQKTDVTFLCYLQVCCQSHFRSARLQSFTGHVSGLEGELEYPQGFWFEAALSTKLGCIAPLHHGEGLGLQHASGQVLQQYFMPFLLYSCSVTGWRRTLFDGWQSSLWQAQCSPKGHRQFALQSYWEHKRKLVLPTPKGQQHCAYTACTPLLALCAYNNTVPPPSPRGITHPSRGEKSHHRKAGSVASKNKLRMLFLLSE